MPRDYPEWLALAQHVAKTRYFGGLTVDQALIIMMAGDEIGLSPIASLRLITVIGGRPTLSPRGALALCMQSPKVRALHYERLADAQGAFIGWRVTLERANGAAYTAQFTLADAQHAGLLDKRDSPWRTYPEALCFWRAIGRAIDHGAPDVVNGLTEGLNLLGEPNTPLALEEPPPVPQASEALPEPPLDITEFAPEPMREEG